MGRIPTQAMASQFPEEAEKSNLSSLPDWCIATIGGSWRGTDGSEWASPVVEETPVAPCSLFGTKHYKVLRTFLFCQLNVRFMFLPCEHKFIFWSSLFDVKNSYG